MATVVNANPGQTILLAVEVLDTQFLYGGSTRGTRVDGYVPTLDYVRYPDGTQLLGSTTMTRIDTGLYQVSVTIPSGSTAIGTYVGSASWSHPTSGQDQFELFIINVGLAFGNAYVSPA